MYNIKTEIPKNLLNSDLNLKHNQQKSQPNCSFWLPQWGWANPTTR